MITNERQYRITKSEARKFERSIAAARVREAGSDVDLRIQNGKVTRFTAKELWGHSNNDTVMLDLWEPYLEPA